MSDNPTADREAALRHYNKHYDNSLLQQVQKSLVSCLCGAFQASAPQLLEKALAVPEINLIMNSLIDAAIEISTPFKDITKQQALIHSIHSAAHPNVDFSQTITLMRQFLAKFETSDAPQSTNFFYTIQTILSIKTAREIASATQNSSSMIGNIRGNTANEILSANSSLLLLAEMVLLGEGNLAYLAEKLQKAQGYLLNTQAQILAKHLSSTK